MVDFLLKNWFVSVLGSKPGVNEGSVGGTLVGLAGVLNAEVWNIYILITSTKESVIII